MQQGSAQVAALHAWEKDPAALLLTTGASDEHGIRPNAHTALGLAIMTRSMADGYAKGLTRQTARDKAIAILRFLLPTHAAGGVTCNDNKPWANQWQSALWAYSAGTAAWLLWDDLDPRQKWLAARMVCDEADRFIEKRPPAQLVSDTKSEENAWNSKVIALAFNMFPKHPHHEAWGVSAAQWAASAFVRDADLRNDVIVDGYPIRDAVAGPNIYDDYTLENHDRVHPDYMNTIGMCGYQHLIYQWGDNSPPQALRFNSRGIYGVLKTLSFPDGGWIYPNGQDWQLHRNADWVNTHAMADYNFDDPQAARLLQICIETSEKMAARNPTGTIVLPTETAFPSTQGMIFELDSFAWLLLSSRASTVQPTPEAQLWRELSGKFVYGSGKFGILRTPHSIASFSWGRQVMGLVMPMQKDLLLTPYTREPGRHDQREWRTCGPDHRQARGTAPYQRSDGRPRHPRPRRRGGTALWLRRTARWTHDLCRRPECSRTRPTTDA